MKWFFGIAILSLFACRNSERVLEKDSSTVSRATTAEKITAVNGNVTQSFSYCGGARPSDEMYREMTASKPMPGAVFYLRKGSTNDVTQPVLDTVKTDEYGKFKLQLEPGTYCIVSSAQLDSHYVKSIYDTYSKGVQYYSKPDKSCLDEWLKIPLVAFLLDGEKEISVEWEVHHPCSWNKVICTHYSGPLPP